MAQHFFKKVMSALKFLYPSFYSTLLNNSDITLLRRTNGIAFNQEENGFKIWGDLVTQAGNLFTLSNCLWMNMELQNILRVEASDLGIV